MVCCKKKTQYELHLWISQQRIAWLKYFFHPYWCQIKYSNVKLKIKNPFRKASHGVEGNNTSESCKSKTPTSSTSLPSPLNYETSIIESIKDTVRDTYHSLKEKVNLLNIEIRVTSEYERNICEALKITQQTIRMYLHLIDTNNYQIMVILKRTVIPGIM